MGDMESYKVMLNGPAPWGFRLQGGKDFSMPLSISRLTPGGKAAQAGVGVGDWLLYIDGESTSSMTHIEAQNRIRACGDRLCLTLSRAQNHLGKPQKVRVAPGAAAAAQPSSQGKGISEWRWRKGLCFWDPQGFWGTGVCLEGWKTPLWRSNSDPWHRKGLEGGGVCPVGAQALAAACLRPCQRRVWAGMQRGLTQGRRLGSHSTASGPLVC
uniref:PDZ domain-containing protein n=1 Tax=Accipiter nisus TaxID=211598 RepID=A0A8B9N796_9AVES